MGESDFEAGISLPYDADISITYHLIKKVNVPFETSEVENLNPDEIKKALDDAGFSNVKMSRLFDMDPDTTESEYNNEIEINGSDLFSKNDEYPFDVEVEIICHRQFTKYTITAHIACDKNLIFSKYDVNVLFDGKLAGTIKHGDSSDFNFRATEGTHTVTFENKDNSTVKGTATIKVSVDTEISYKIHCTSDSVQVDTLWEDKKINIAADEVKIMFDAGTYSYKTITDVMNDFRKLGFTNITTKPIYDQSGEWFETDGELESILIDGKTTFAPNDVFKKNVPIIITYHTKKLSKEQVTSIINGAIGKEASEIFAALEGVRYTLALSVSGETVSTVDNGFILVKGRFDSDKETIYLEFMSKSQIELTTQLENNFPQENAVRAAVVALTNSQATDVFSADGSNFDTSKFHSYSDISGFFMIIVERGTWSAKDDHTWHVNNIRLKIFVGEAYLKASLDVSLSGSNYIVSDVYKTVGAKDKIDDGKTYTTDHIEPSDDHPYLTVPASLIEENRDESAVNSMISEKERHEEWVNSQFSWWDGSHVALEELVKKQLNDESSYKHIKTVYIEIYDETKAKDINEILEKGGYSQRVDVGDLFIEMQFSAKNAFNATIKANAIGIADYSTNQIILIDFLY